MASITITASKVNILNDKEVIKLRGQAGATMTAGKPVYLDGTNGWKYGDGDVAGSALARGVLMQDCVQGQTIDIIVYGRVGGYNGMTPGANVYVSLTAGDLDQTAPSGSGDFVSEIGWASAADVLFVNPRISVPVALA